jgi:hypothetical protein
LSELDEVRRQAAGIEGRSLTDRTDDELRSELESLDKRLRSEIASRTGFSTGKGGNAAGGAVAGAWVRLAQAAREGAGLDPLVARISAIEDEIARRRSPPHP